MSERPQHTASTWNADEVSTAATSEHSPVEYPAGKGLAAAPGPRGSERRLGNELT